MRRLYDFVVQRSLEMNGPESLDYATVLNCYGAYLFAVEGAFEEAMDYFLPSWSIMQDQCIFSIHIWMHRKKLTLCKNIVDTYQRLGDFKNACKYCKLGFEKSAKINGPEHAITKNYFQELQFMKRKKNWKTISRTMKAVMKSYEKKMLRRPKLNSKIKILLKQLILDRRCECCGKNNKTLKQCLGCGKVFYCNAKCQKKHWKNGHKEQCQLYQEFEN